MPTFDITEFDIIFLSYDEPNAEKHWANLLNIAPYAKRVHGVKGFDNAHRACAHESETDWFITVDADNIVDPSFFDQKLELDPVARPNQCFSWNGINMVNGLQYGNGGLKLWSKNFVLTMNTHENADDPRKAVEFCWEEDYEQIHRSYSYVYVTGSPFQAFKAGFREGVKLAMDRGMRISPAEMLKTLHDVNLRNLRIWSCVGRDVENGVYAILGARWGWERMCDLDWDHTLINDAAWFKTLWADTVSGIKNVDAEIERLGKLITEKTKIKLPYLRDDESDFFRETFKLRND